jgi:hypothetical protein
MSDIFKPRGPFPLFLDDLERATLDWAAADRYAYLRVLFHLWNQGGFIPDDDDLLLKIMGFRKGRGYREKLALIRSKLQTYPLTKPLTKALAFDEAKRLLFQKRVLNDLEKAKRHSDMSRYAVSQRRDRQPTDGKTGILPLSHTLPTNQKDDGVAECFRVARNLFPDRDPGSLVTKLLDFMDAPAVLAAIEGSRGKKDPWTYLWSIWRRRKGESDERAKRTAAPHPADEHIYGTGGG